MIQNVLHLVSQPLLIPGASEDSCGYNLQSHLIVKVPESGQPNLVPNAWGTINGILGDVFIQSCMIVDCTNVPKHMSNSQIFSLSSVLKSHLGKFAYGVETSNIMGA